MDRNSIIGLFLIFIVILAWQLTMAPEPDVIAEQNRTEQTSSQEPSQSSEADETINSADEFNSSNQTTLPHTQEDSISLAQAAEIANQKHGVFTKALRKGEDREFVIENNKIKATLSTGGGIISKVELKEYKTHDSLPLILFDSLSSYNIAFKYLNKGYINTGEYSFVPISKSFQVEEGAYKEFVMRLQGENSDQYLDFIYGIDGDTYQVDFKIQLNNLGDVVDLQRDLMYFDWNMVGYSNEKSVKFERQACTVYFKYPDEKRDFLSESSDEKEALETKTEWIAFKQNFFSAIAMPKNGFLKDGSEIEITTFDDEINSENHFSKKYRAIAALPIKDAQRGLEEIDFYFGPNHYQTLAAYDNGIDGIINLGWGIFGWMNKWLVIPIFNFLDDYIISYGIIILILTIIIKMLLFPLTYRNYKSSAKMRVLKPEIEELNKKFENAEPVKKQQATMALYRQTGVNPMAGCIPMIIQLPILYAMFRFFPSSIELRQQHFLWATDLSAYDDPIHLPFTVPFGFGDHISLFTLLMAISTMVYTHMNSKQMPTVSQPGMPNMKVIMYFFPIMMLFFFNSYASGLSYYYFLANLISMIQMVVIKEFFIDEDKLRAQIARNKKKPKKKSNFQKRMEDMAKQRTAKSKR